MGFAPWNPQIPILSHYFNWVWGDLITTLVSLSRWRLSRTQHCTYQSQWGGMHSGMKNWFSETGGGITPSTNTITVHATWAEGRLMPVDGRDRAATR